MDFPRKSAVSACSVAILATTLAAAPANAQSSVCVQLEARLVALERGGGAGSVQEAREHDRAIRRQQQEIDRATAEARRSRCVGGFFLIRRQPAPKCGELMATIDRMKANLRRLLQSRPQAGGQFGATRERNEILRSMDAYGCGASQTQRQARVRSAPRATGLFAALFGPARVRGLGEDIFFRGGGAGTYRTLCVRTCDGYYFPISFSTVPGQFAADEQTCRNMCPGTQVGLYTHRNPGEDTDAMQSLAGQPYTALPTAFKYRKEYDPSCTCGSPVATNVATNVATLGAAFDLGGGPRPQQQQRLLVALPEPRPAPGEDPETLANRAGGFTPEIHAQVASAVGYDAGPVREVRVVGPAYYYGQEDADFIDLVPAGKPSLRDETDGSAANP